MPRRAKGSAFKMRSGNKPPFKQMGQEITQDPVSEYGRGSVLGSSLYSSGLPEQIGGIRRGMGESSVGDWKGDPRMSKKAWVDMWQEQARRQQADMAMKRHNEKLDEVAEKHVKDEILKQVILTTFDHTEDKAQGTVKKLIRDLSKEAKK